MTGVMMVSLILKFVWLKVRRTGPAASAAAHARANHFHVLDIGVTPPPELWHHGKSERPRLRNQSLNDGHWGCLPTLRPGVLPFSAADRRTGRRGGITRGPT